MCFVARKLFFGTSCCQVKSPSCVAVDVFNQIATWDEENSSSHVAIYIYIGVAVVNTLPIVFAASICAGVVT